MAVSQWISARYEIRAVIGETEFRDIVEFSSVFEVNNIPMARLLVSTGRNVRTLKAATVHNLAKKWVIQMPAKVYLKVVPLNAAPGVTNPWPSKEFLIFEGAAVGNGWVRSREGMYYSIALTHWLDDLNNSSALSATSHPYNPADFTFGGVFAAATDGAGASEPYWTPLAGPQKDAKEADIEEDLWMRVLHPWLVAVAGQDRIDVVKVGLGGSSQGGNKAAIKALNRMTSAAGDGKYVPLTMDLAEANKTAILAGLMEAIQYETGNDWVNTTLWGKLVGDWAPSYFFSVIPRIEDAMIVPYAGGLKEPYKTLEANDLVACQLNGTMPQVLRAVGIFCAVGDKAGGGVNPAEYPTTYNQLGGIFPANWDDAKATGLILLKNPPRWLTSPSHLPSYSRDTTGAESAIPTGNALAPGEGSAPTEIQGTPDANSAKLANKQGTKGGLLDRYAHQLYVLEMLKARAGEASGRLRFDVAPGSSVKIESGAERILGSRDQLSQPFFANVVRVTHMINAETRVSGTSFAIDHVRTEAENDDTTGRMSIDKSPLYQTAWKGVGLHKLFT